MKQVIIIAILFLTTAMVINIDAQVKVGVQINIGAQPVWGPVGYETVQYYYIPEIEAYYSVPKHVFWYFDRGIWVKSTMLPPRYASFDLYRAYKVVINENRPWLRHDVYRVKYASFAGRHDQVVIRDSHDPRYFVIKEHPEHAKVVKEVKVERRVVKEHEREARRVEKAERREIKERGERDRGERRER